MLTVGLPLPVGHSAYCRTATTLLSTAECASTLLCCTFGHCTGLCFLQNFLLLYSMHGFNTLHCFLCANPTQTECAKLTQKECSHPKGGRLMGRKSKMWSIAAFSRKKHPVVLWPAGSKFESRISDLASVGSRRYIHKSYLYESADKKLLKYLCR